MQWRASYQLALAWGILLPLSLTLSVCAWVPSLPSSSSSTSSSSTSSTSSSASRQRRTFFQSPPSSFLLAPLGVGGRGWDNENFLEALGQGDDALRKANDEYEALSRFGHRPNSKSAGRDNEDAAVGASVPSTPSSSPSSTTNDDDLLSSTVPGAVLTDEMKAQIKAANEAEPDGSQGGQLFREMLARAKRGDTLAAPAATTVPPPPPVVPPTTNAASLDNLSVEQQAELFRQMMAQQQQQQQQQLPIPATPPPVAVPLSQPPLAINPGALPRRTSGGDDRRKASSGTARNRDADAIVNTSDLYFAQLKLDSTLRNYARYTGDDDKANAVFADPSIREIKAHVNPALQEMRKKEAAMLETAADEMLILPTLTDATPNSGKVRSYAGVSYKQKLQQRRNQQQSSTTTALTSTSAESTSVVVPTPSPPPPVPAPPQVSSPPTMTTTTMSSGVGTDVPASSSSAVADDDTSTTTTTTTTTTTDDEESLRRDIRTVMGLLLKHRGGPGFGGGRLHGVDVDRFETLTQQVLTVLKQQGVPDTAHPAPSTTSSLSQSTTISSSLSQSATTTPSPRAPPSSSGAPENTAARVQNMISCIEGGIQMYRNSPPELREGVLVTFRAALVSAIHTVSEILEPTTGQVQLPTPSSGSGGTQTDDDSSRVNAMIALIEGAVVMYKNSPPELQTSILVTLRAALLSAIGTLNSIIAFNEVENVRAYQAAAAAAATVAPSTPAPPAQDGPVSFYEVVPSVQTGAAPTPAAAVSTTVPETKGTDANSRFFEELRDKLQSAKGDGVMGLRTDLSGSTAAELADDLARMRSLLVQELENGIPEPTASSSSTPSSNGDRGDSSSATSRYQEMLAKARSEKSN